MENEDELVYEEKRNQEGKRKARIKEGNEEKQEEEEK